MCLIGYLSYQTPIFDWCVVRCGSKNEHQKDLYFKEIGLRAQNVLTILCLKANITGGDPYGRITASTLSTLKNHTSNM